MPPTSGIVEPELANGEPPDYHRKMDRRLIILETRFDTILPTLATKADLIGLRAELKGDNMELRTEFRSEIHSMEGRLKAEMQKMHNWIVAIPVCTFIGFGGLFVLLLTLPRPA